MSSSKSRLPSMLAIAPFPALNPWNWGATSPASAASAGVILLKLQMSAWRACFDASCAMWRQQQDATLLVFEELLWRAAERGEAAPSSMEEDIPGAHDGEREKSLRAA